MRPALNGAPPAVEPARPNGRGGGEQGTAGSANGVLPGTVGATARCAPSSEAAAALPPPTTCDSCRTPVSVPTCVAAGSAGSLERSPRLERHHVRLTSLEPVSPALARWPDGTPVRAERSPPSRRISLATRRELFPPPAEEAVLTAAPPVPPRRTVSLAVAPLYGAPRWPQRPRAYAARAAEPVRTDPLRKLSAQYDDHIHQMRDEQERVQKKTFLNWINSYLRKHQPPMQMHSLIEDLKDGSRLLALLQVLSGQKLPVERGRILKRAHFLSNANTALQFLHSKNIKLVNINPSDIVDGRPAVVLGLIWTVILYFQIEENTRVLEQLARRSSVTGQEARSATATPTGTAPSAGAQASPAARGGARRTLLNWARTATRSYGIDINDFGSSWRDGKAFVAIVHCINPTCIDVNATERMATQERLDKVFKVAEEDLGIARLLDAEDVNVRDPDEKSIMTYVAQFLHKYPDPKAVAQPATGAARSPGQEVNEIADWVAMTRQALSALRPPQQDDFMSFKSVKNDASERYLRYEKLKTLGLQVPGHVWTRVDEEWNSLERLLSEWQSHLDSRLPEPLLSVVQWITGAETFLEAGDDAPTEADERTAKLLTASLEEHMSFFGELPRVEAELRRGAQLPAAAQLPPQQLAHIDKRLKAVRGQAHRRWVRLKYLEHRCCIIAFLILMEGRVRAWTVKLGHQPRVEQMLHEYQTFVSDRNVFHEFEQAFIEMKQVADAFVKEGGVGPQEKEVVVHFINEVGERWRSVSVELQCLRSMLEEVLSCWKKFSQGSEALSSWMDTAETMVTQSEEQKLEFFQDLPSWSERYQQTEDSGQFLTAACQDDVAAEVQNALQQLQTRWQQLFKHVKRYMQSGQIRQRLAEFSEATARPRRWAETAEALLTAPLDCRQPQLAHRRQEAQELLAELPDVEADLKTAGKLIQLLGEDVSPEKQQEMTQTLRELRESVSDGQAGCQQQADVCAQSADRLAAAGRGQAEVSAWLDELSKLLDGPAPATEAGQVAQRADQLQTVLSRQLYCRSLLDSTTKIVSGLLEAARAVPALDTTQLEREQAAVSGRFAELTAGAERLQQELSSSSDAWRRFEAAERGVTEWLEVAEQLLTERADTEAAVEQHKRVFYEAPTERLTELSECGRELFESLPPEAREPVKATVARLHDRWQRTVERGPAHLARLEVLATLSQLSQQLTELERHLADEDHAIHRGGELAQLAERHRSTVQPLADRIGEKLADARETCQQLGSQDREVVTQLRSLEDRWRHLQRRSDSVSSQLEQMSARWSEYEQRRQQTADWLSAVEQSLQTDIDTVDSPQQLQNTRDQFQAVFGELAQRKQTMRWLVSTLDALVTSVPGPEAETQRQQLSELVMRYKELVPRLETTAVRLDGLAKCHSYRVEIDEIVRVLYEARAESAAVPTVWESADQLADSRQQQQRAVQRLEEQRPRVLAAVQRGRDLSRDLSQAPALLPEALEQLELVWAESNAEVIQRLDSATETERLWTELADRRADLQCALATHRSALDAAADTAEPGPALAELAAHVQTQQPERARQMQQRLQQIAQQLGGRLAPEAAQQLKEQVEESDADVAAVSEQLQQKMDNLTSAAQTWAQVSDRVEAVRLGLQSAQRSQQRLSTLDMPPETRRQQLQQLTQQLQQHAEERQQLNELMDTLQSEGYDGGQFRSELAILGDTLQHMSEAAAQQRAVLEDEYKHWHAYQEQVGELVPWLDWAEEKVAADLPRPAQLEEAAEILQQCQHFEDQCVDKEPAVKVIVDESAQMVQVFNVSDQADSLVTRWTKVRETSVAWVQQMQGLVTALRDVHTELSSVRQWLDEVGAAVPAEGDVPDASQELDTLQPAVSELPGRQSAVLGLQQRCDQLADLLNPEGAAALRSHVAALRSEVSQLNQTLRQRQAKTADAASQREETYRRLTALTGWLDGLKTQLAEFDRVQIDSLWECLTSLAAMQQELTSKLPNCESVREDATSLYNERPSKENAQLRDHSEQLCAAARQTQTAVTDRHQAVGLWADLASHSKRLGDQLSVMSDRLQSDSLTAEKVPQLKQDLVTLQSEQAALEAEAAALAPAAERAGLTVLRGELEQPPAELSDHTLRHLQQLLDQLDEHDGRLAERQQVWEKFCGDRDGLVTWLEATRSRVSAEQAGCARLAELPELLSQLDCAQREADSRTEAFQALHQESQAVLESDPARFSEVHEEVVNLDRAWNNLRQTLTETAARHQSLWDAWKAVQEALQAANAAIDGAEAFQQGLGTAPSAASDLEQSLSDGRRAAEKLALRAQLERTLPDLESAQVLWAQAARAQDEGLRWAAAAQQTLRSAADGAAGLRETAARLEQCRHELTAHQTAARAAADKVDEVTRLLSASEVPALESGRRRLAEQLAAVETALRGTQTTLDGLVSREATLRGALGRCAESAIELRQRVATLDEPAGTPEQVVARLQTADECAETAAELETALAAVQTDIDAMKEEGLPTSTYQKEHSLLAAKLKNIKTQLKRVTALLGGSLEKKFTLLLKDSKKDLSALSDKLTWLESAPAEDRAAVETRRDVLAEVSQGLEAARAAQSRLAETADQYLAALPEQRRPAVTAALQQHGADVDEVAGRAADAQTRTDALLAKWTEFEAAAAEVSQPLTEIEASELPAGHLTSPDEIAPHRATAEQSVTRLQGLAEPLRRAAALAAELAELSADCAAPQQARQLEARLEAQQRLAAAQQRRLAAAAEAAEQYRQAERAMTSWLKESRQELTKHEAVLAASRPTLGQQQRMKEMRESLGRCHDGQQYLTAATTPAEQLLAELAPSARETVRAELRALRDSWEKLMDDANQALKKLEALVLQLSSFDDCFRQVVTWLDGAEAQLEEELEPRATLPEKTAVLRDELARRQEVQLRQHMVAQLRERAELAADGAPPAELAECLRRYEALEQAVGARVERAQAAVDRHQALARAQQAVGEWLSAQQGRLAAVMAENEPAAALLPAVERLEAAAQEGLGLLKACEAALDAVRPDTAPEGGAALDAEMGRLQADHHRYISDVSDLRFRLQAAQQQQQAQQECSRQLGDWLLKQEQAVAEPALLDTQPEKVAEADRLEALCAEVSERQSQLAQQLGGGGGGLLQPLQARCQQLLSQLQEQAARTRQMAGEHGEYESRHAALLEWIEEAQRQLTENSAVVGQLSVLRERRRLLEELSDEWCRRSGELDSLLTLGERLYAHTGPLGRETVRAHNMSVRAGWERLSDALQAGCQRLDSCLQQFAEFSEQQEQLTRWLHDVEQAMAAHAQLRATLQEKQAQLQSHELTDQEIGAHHSLVTDVCSRAGELIAQTQDNSLQTFVTSIQALFDTIRTKSKEILEHLSECVRRHEELQTASRQQASWLASQREQLAAADSVSGEPTAVQQRRDALQKVQSRLPQGRRQMKKIHDACVHTVLGTSEQGGAALQAAVTALDDDWKAFEQQCAAADTRLQEAADQWAEYERRHRELTAWCAEHEQLFSQLQLKATLDEKLEVLQRLQAARQAIVGREADVDQLIDCGNDLAQLSGLERINTQVKQVSTRYQELHMASQSLLTKWQNMMDDHRAYDEKLAETEAWLRDTPATEQADRGQHLVSSLCSLGERLFSGSSAAGRDLVRQQMRAAKEGWEARQAANRAAQQEAAARSRAEEACTEAISQVCSWLDGTERTLAAEPTSWLAAAELKAKLQKIKTAQSDEPHYRRLLDGVEPRCGLLPEPARAALQSATARLQAASADSRRQRERLETLLDQLSAHQELVRAHQDWHRTTDEQIKAVSDPAGGRTALSQRAARAAELCRQLTDGAPSLSALTAQAARLSPLLPEKWQAALQRELQQHQSGADQLLLAVQEAQHALQSRLGQWSACEAALESVVGWLNEAEATLKNHYTHKNTLEEKEEQLRRFRELSAGLHQQEARLDKLAADVQELSRSSGDNRMTFIVQQAVSRANNVQVMTKDLLSRYEEGVSQHRDYVQQYNAFLAEFSGYQEQFAAVQTAPVRRSTLKQSLQTVQQLLAGQPAVSRQLAAVSQLGERLYAATAPDGRQLLQGQLQQLQAAHDTLYDQLAATEKQLMLSDSKFSGYDESAAELRRWVDEARARVSQELELKATLDDKCDQLQSYRLLLHDLVSHQQAIADCREKASALPDRTDEVTRLLDGLAQQHQEMLETVQERVERYEAIVADHQQYTKAVLDAQEFLESTHSAIEMWGRAHGELVTIRANLDKLKQLKAGLLEEAGRVTLVQTLGEKVIPNTSAQGQQNVRAQLESTEQEWQALSSSAEAAINGLQRVLDQWSRFEQMKDQWAAWLKETDMKLHAVNLKDTLQQKKDQLEELQAIQGEVRARELEIDALTDRAEELSSACSAGRQSQHGQIIAKYQQVAQTVQELVATWQQYVASHSDYSRQLSETSVWLKDVQSKLAYCSDLSATSQKELEAKLATVKDLLLYKDEGFKRVHAAVDLGHQVLRNTEPTGHQAISEQLTALQESWGSMATQMAETKSNLDEAIHRWAGFLEEIQRLKRSSDATGAVLQEAAQFQTTMAEKRAQLDRLKSLEESLRCEKYEVDSLKSKAAEMSASGNQAQAAAQAQQILNQYDQTADRIRLLRREREEQYKHHRSWKQAFDEFQAWMSTVREKVPAVRQRSFGDRSAIEGVVAALDGILCKQSAGQLTLEHLVHTGDVMMASTSELGQKEIRQDVANAQSQFEEFFNDIRQQKRNLETIESQLKSYKEEYERISDWLQAADVQVKQHKTVFVATREEKQQLVEKIQDVCRSLESGGEDISRLQSTASGLLASHLEGYISQQLRHLASRHQVQVNLARDVERKLVAIADQHSEFEGALRRAADWMEEAREVIRGRSGSGSGSGSDGEPDSGRQGVEQHLKAIQELIRNQDEGQTLVHQAASLGEKVLRNTHSSGREDVKQAMKDIQNDWDRFIKKLTNAKAQLETSLLQWSDAGSTYTRLQRWISDREARLQQVLEHKPRQRPSANKDQLASLGEKKAALRRTNSIMQDIVSFQPMIASVTSSSEGARGRRRHASEISDKYETLSRQARQAYERQKQLVEQHGAFIDAAGEFITWLQTARERRAKCAEPTGHRDALASRMTALKLLEADVSEGQSLLDSALELAKAALQVAEDEDDREVIEEQVAKLQAQMDDYRESVAATRELLESGVVKWTKYEERLKQCQAWISDKESEVQTYGGLHAGLQEKQTAVEAFQTLLSDMYEWQSTLDELNVSATLLLDNCADSRIANSVTQLTTKYNALQSLAKDVFRRLEVAHLEHKQHSALCHEIDEWMEKTREKLAETAPLTSRHSELLTKLHTVQSLRASVEQGQKKLRYAMELKERVIMNTAEGGGTRIEQDADTLSAEFDKLIADIMERKNELTAKIGELDEIFKANQTLTEALDDIDAKIQGDGDLLFSELNEKKTALEKYRALATEVQSLSNQVSQLRTTADAAEGEKALPEIVQTLERHRLTAAKVDDAIKVLEERAAQHERYAAAHTAAADWLKAARLGLQQASDATGAWDELNARLEANRTLTDTLPKGKSLLDDVVSQGEALQEVCPAGGHQSLAREAEALQVEYDSLCKLAASSEAALSRCVAAWSEFTALHDDLRSWLEKARDREPPAQTASAAPAVNGDDDQHLQTVKTLWSEVSERRRSVDRLADRCETLIELSGQPEVREQAVQLQADHAALLSRLQATLSQLERRCQSEREVTAARAELATWLERNRGTVADCRQLQLTAPQLTDNLHMLTLVSTRMTEGQHLLGALQTSYTAAAESRPAEAQQELTEDLTRLRAEYDQLAIELQQVSSEVKSRLQRWEETADTVSQLDTWLKELTTRLDAAPEPTADLAHLRATLERLTDAQKRLEARRPDLDSALEEATQLSAGTEPVASADGGPALLARAQDVRARWEAAEGRCRELVAKLQTEVEEFNEYNSSLHEAQKWLLQISYQLMGQNAQYISNREQTAAQIERHKEVMSEFESFSDSLRDLERRGHSQVERYEEVSPAIRQEVDKQLDNIRSSYSSLHATAQQINTRLLESLKKFEQYEALLESIGENLSARQRQLEQEVAEPIPDLETAKQRLEATRSLHNELQSEKSRLDTAVQICEAATASISRPSSPHDQPPDTVPERELQVRCQLELLIDQAQSRLAELQRTADGLQRLDEREDEVRRWAEQQARLVAELGRQRARLQPEPAAAELERLRELQRTLLEREASLDELDSGRMELAAEVPTESARQELARLAEQVAEVLNARTTAQSCVEEYTTALQNFRQWHRQTSDSLQAVDSQSSPADGRLRSLAELRRECDDQRQQLQQLEQLAEAARERLTEPEAQHVTSQVLSTQRSYEELCRRLEQRTESVRSAAEQADRLLDQLRQLAEWTANAQRTAAGLATPIGYTPEVVTDRINQIQSLESETNSKRSMLPQFAKAISSLAPNISAQEREQLATNLQQMEGAVKELSAALETQTAALRRARADRERLQKACSELRQQLTDATEQLQLPEQLPLPAAQVQLLIDQRNTLLSQLESVSARRVPELRQQAAPLLADCSQQDAGRLQELLQRLQEDAGALQERAQAGRDQLLRVHEARRRLESELEQCGDWLHTARVTLKQEPLAGTSLHTLHEHVHKMAALQEDFDSRQRQLAGLLELSEQLLPELRPPDKLTLTDQLSTLKTQYTEVGSRIEERTEAFRSATAQQEAINGKIASSVTYLTEIKKEIRALNRPLGSGVEDAQGILSSYEEVLQKLREFRSQLESLQDQTVGSISDLNDLIRQQDELVRAIENQVSKLRNLVLLRQQFLHLLTEITTFLTSHADVVADVERTDRPVPDKIKQYSAVLAKVQDIEALLAAAQDKGQQISEEGTVSDRNAILKQLQSLKQQVTLLKRAVENKRRQYEETAEKHAALTDQLASQLDWLHERQTAVQSRPALTMDDAELHRHCDESQTLCDEARPALDRLQQLVTEADGLGPGRELPAGLQQQLSQARGLLQTLPNEITDRQTYLQEARRLLDQYRSTKQAVSEWARHVGESVEAAEEEGTDAEQSQEAVNRCQTLMSEETARRGQVSELQDTVDRLLPLLAPGPRSQLDANQRQLVVSYEAIVARAAELLEGAARQLEARRRVDALLAQVRAALSAAVHQPTPPSSQEALREAATQARQARAALDSKLPLLSELRTLVDSLDGSSGGEGGASEADLAQDEWRQAADRLDSAASHMDDMIQLWHYVERELLSLESAADAASDSVEALRPADSASDRHALVKQVQTCRTELGQLRQRHGELAPRAADLLTYLQGAQSPAHGPLTERTHQLQINIDGIVSRLDERHQQLQAEATFAEEAGRRADAAATRLEQHRAALSELDPYGADQEDTARRLQGLREASDSLGSEVTALCSEVSERYEHGTPRDIAAKVSRVELLWDGCRQARADLDSETERAGRVLTEYRAGLGSVSEWLGDLDVRLRSGALDPEELRAATEELQAELAVTAVTMADVSRLAGVITERARCQRQRADVQQAVQRRHQELDAARQRLEKRHAQVMESLDSWSRFIELHASVRDWMKKQAPLAQQPRTLNTLPEARDALNEYKAAVKECKWATRKLHEMATELSSIGETSSVDALTERMSSCEHDKIETETLLKERMSLLMEMTEEWEQCERKMKDVHAWCATSRAALESQQARRRPLRDQLAFCEKMSSDNGIQRTRLAMAVDKLGVHFRSGYFDGASVVEERRAELETELRALQTTVDQHCQALGVCVAQLEQYQQDVQTLRARILEVDQQLRTVSQPAHVAKDRDAALAQQEDCRERIKSLHAKITARNERIKLLIQRGKPDPDPLPANP
ncbi:nesprin-1-like [Amphibalanus amphitrite]|uniref:nesprin-1-like n=1 Tax=Amphibalanus amphitrite TaxID=1232801 RepID=UPI001C915882|nr:nesprin-1-like [Amphibalanus amphitrite]